MMSCRTSCGKQTSPLWQVSALSRLLSQLTLDIDLSLGRLQTRVGGDIQAAVGTGGLTNSAGTTVHFLQFC